MNHYHKELLEQLASYPLMAGEDGRRYSSYMGTDKIVYYLNTAEKVHIAKAWVKAHPEITEKEYVDLLTALYAGESHTEILLASKILEHSPRLRQGLSPQLLHTWLSRASGWGEVDSICQSNFSADELLAQWEQWEPVIRSLSVDENIHKRRASLVLLANPLRKSSDPKLSSLAFEIVERLKSEKSILITKAISWVLRSLVSNHRQELVEYLQKNRSTLPAIAMRETMRKVETGRK